MNKSITAEELKNRTEANAKRYHELAVKHIIRWINKELKCVKREKQFTVSYDEFFSCFDWSRWWEFNFIKFCFHGDDFSDVKDYYESLGFKVSYQPFGSMTISWE